MTPRRQVLAPEIAMIVADVAVDGATRTAVVGERIVEGDSPRELAVLLGDAIYATSHAGMAHRSDTARRRTLRDPVFEARLAEATPHSSTRVAVRVDGFTGDGTAFLGWMEGVRVRLPREVLLDAAPTAFPADATAVIPAGRPALSSGFYLVDGPYGRERSAATLRVYLHIEDAHAAPEVWSAVLGVVNGAGVRYRAKIGSAPSLYPRNDALVLYLGSDAWQVLPGIRAVAANLRGTGVGTSAFAVALSESVAVAWDPDDRRPGRRGLSFGQHRSLVLAEALVAHATEEFGDSVESAVAEAFRDANIDPGCPARNQSSEPFLGNEFLSPNSLTGNNAGNNV